MFRDVLLFESETSLEVELLGQGHPFLAYTTQAFIVMSVQKWPIVCLKVLINIDSMSSLKVLYAHRHYSYPALHDEDYGVLTRRKMRRNGNINWPDKRVYIQ